MIVNVGHLDRLRKTYPRLFMEEGMPWGFEHGDGWNQLIDGLCAKINSILKDAPEASITIRQVKEKMGTLRFYYRLQGVDEEHANVIQNAVDLAYAESERVCELCSHAGTLQQTSRGLKTLCASCREAYEQDDDRT